MEYPVNLRVRESDINKINIWLKNGEIPLFWNIETEEWFKKNSWLKKQKWISVEPQKVLKIYEWFFNSGNVICSFVNCKEINKDLAFGRFPRLHKQLVDLKKENAGFLKFFHQWFIKNTNIFKKLSKNLLLAIIRNLFTLDWDIVTEDKNFLKLRRDLNVDENWLIATIIAQQKHYFKDWKTRLKKFIEVSFNFYLEKANWVWPEFIEFWIRNRSRNHFNKAVNHLLKNSEGYVTVSYLTKIKNLLIELSSKFWESQILKIDDLIKSENKKITLRQPKSAEEKFNSCYKEVLLPLMNEISERNGWNLLKTKKYEEYNLKIKKRWNKVFKISKDIRQRLISRVEEFYSEEDPVKIIKRLKSINRNDLHHPIFIKKMSTEEMNTALSARYPHWLSKDNLKKIEWSPKKFDDHEFPFLCGSDNIFKCLVKGDSNLSFCFTTSKVFHYDNFFLNSNWKQRYIQREANFPNYLIHFLSRLPWEVQKYLMELKEILENYWIIGKHSFFSANFSVINLNKSILNFIFSICMLDQEWKNVKKGNFNNLRNLLSEMKWFPKIGDNQPPDKVTKIINRVKEVRNLSQHTLNKKYGESLFFFSDFLWLGLSRSFDEKRFIPLFSDQPWQIKLDDNSGEFDNIGLEKWNGQRIRMTSSSRVWSPVDLLKDITANTLKLYILFQEIMPDKLGTGKLRTELMDRFKKSID